VLLYLFLQSHFSPGSYDWNADCTDIYNNLGNGSQRSFTVTAPSSGGDDDDDDDDTGSTPPSSGIITGYGLPLFSNKIDIVPEIINVNLTIGSSIVEEIEIFNRDVDETYVNLTVRGLSKMIALKKKLLKIDPGKSEIVKINLFKQLT